MNMNTETQNEIAETNTEVVGPSQEKIFIQLKKLPEIPKTYKKYDKLNEKQKKKIDDIWNALSKEVKDKIIEDANNYVDTTNRGTGAGGANTNANGLPFEEKVHLKTEYASSILTEHPIKSKKTKLMVTPLTTNQIKFGNSDIELVEVSGYEFHRYMEFIREMNMNKRPMQGCIKPDEAYVDNNRKHIYIIEKKTQGEGSTDEKIQTAATKSRHYRKLFPNYKIYYMYCLSDHFKFDKYESVMEELQEDNIPVFWGDDADYKSKIIEFILNNSV